MSSVELEGFVLLSFNNFIEYTGLTVNVADYPSHSVMTCFYLLCMAIAFGLTVVMTKLCRWWRHRHYDLPARDIRKGHRWVMTDMFTQPTYCNISQNHIIHGAFCDSCGVCVEDRYITAANKKLRCKELANLHEHPKHHWIRGNIPLCSKCAVCQDDCGNLPQLCDYRCCWCARTIHEKCATQASDRCDLGEYKKSVVPPNCIRLKLVGLKGRRHFVVDSVKEPPIPNWKPLIVIANRKSGNGDGEHILQAFRSLLNPAQVIDLSDITPECGLEWCHLLPHVTCRVLVAGGDGTIGWVLQAIDNLKQKPSPEVGILPLGTGNDLSRVLGWGEGYTGDVDVKAILDLMRAADVVKLDRWRLEIVPEKHFGIRMPKKVIPKKSLIMNNYASIGVDALVTLNFHKHRESRPSLFGSRLINKFWYFTYGTKDVLERECKDLHKKVKLEMDGKKIDLPEIEGIVILNISSWGGGCQPWQKGGNGGEPVPDSRYNDGMMEVFALYSSFHIAQLQVGLAEPLRLGQAKTVKISLSKGNAPMQVDGEPWEQTPAVISISLHNQATMLANYDS